MPRSCVQTTLLPSRSRWGGIRLYRKLVDGWRVYDNSGEVPPQMTERPWRFPEGEPSQESILAALILARKDAMRRVAEYEAKEAAKAVAEAEDGDGEPQSTQSDTEGELP